MCVIVHFRPMYPVYPSDPSISITAHYIYPTSVTADVPGCSLTAFIVNVTGRSLSYMRLITSFPALADHRFLRVNMCTLATEQASQWLMLDPWEAFQSYQRTAVVLDHFDYEINTVLGGAQLPSSLERRHIRVVLLAGSDLISTMSEPGVWSEKDVSPSRRTQLGEFLTCTTSWTTSLESTARVS
jgi:hypothetical protein